jgi:hypothetical protein
MNTPNEDRDIFQPESFDPFPQPQTIPAGWDLSGLFPELEFDSIEQNDDLADESLLSTQGDK